MKKLIFTLPLLALAACGGDKVYSGFGVADNGSTVSGQVVDYGREISYEFTLPQQYHCSSGRIREPRNKRLMDDVLVSCVGVGYGVLVLSYVEFDRQLVGQWSLNDGRKGYVIFENYKL